MRCRLDILDEGDRRQGLGVHRHGYGLYGRVDCVVALRVALWDDLLEDLSGCSGGFIMGFKVGLTLSPIHHIPRLWSQRFKPSRHKRGM